MSQKENQTHFAEVEPTPVTQQQAPTLYFEGFEGFIYNQTIVKFNVTEGIIARASDAGSTIRKRTVAHLVMPLPTLVFMHKWLGEQMGMIRERNEKFEKELKSGANPAAGATREPTS